MPVTPRKGLTSLPRPRRPALMLLAPISIVLSACASTPSAEPPPTARWPRPAPLPAAILRIDTGPSTHTLSEGLRWSQDSEAILRDATTK